MDTGVIDTDCTTENVSSANDFTENTQKNDEEEDIRMKVELFQNFPRSLRVLLILDVLHALLGFLSPQDSIEFLSSHSTACRPETGWKIMRKLFGLPSTVLTKKEKGKTELPYTNERDLILKVVRKYGFSCTECYTLLDGPDGFFCCTSLCKECSEKKFLGHEFVDSVVRFYLCGSENITVRGRAFLVHPFWFSLHDESTHLVKQYGSALKIAELIYIEKMFFATWAPQLDRPRDDKSASLMKMVHKEILEARAEAAEEDTLGAQMLKSSGFRESKEEECGEEGTRQDEEQEKEEQEQEVPVPPTAAASTRTAASASISLFQSSASEIEQLQKRLDRSWGQHVPASLKTMYNQAISTLKADHHVRQQEEVLNSFGKSTLGTMPLRDLVKSLHVKGSGNIKVLN